MKKRLNKVALVFAIMLLVLNVRVEASSPEEININGMINSGVVDEEVFDLKDSNMKKLLEGKFKDGSMDYIEIERLSKIETTKEDNYLVADILKVDNGKLGHTNKFIYMEGHALLQNIVDDKVKEEKVITTKEERDLIDSGLIDYKHWNKITYQNSGEIRFNQPGYYLMSLKDSSYEVNKGHMLVKVSENKKDEQVNFKDVKSKDWFHDDVYEALNLGMLEGVGWSMYDPHGDLTIAEALTIASRVNARNEGKLFIPGGEKWYSNSIDYAISKDIIGESDFSDYNRKATREEMAYIFSRALPENGYKVINPKVNVTDITNSKYKDNINKLYKSGIVVGRGGSNGFDPSAVISRAEVAAIVNRIANVKNRIVIK